MNLNSFFQLHYYFDSRPSVGYFDFLLHLLIFFCLLFILATYYKIAYGVYRRHLPYYTELADKVSSWLYTVSILGLFYLFFRYEGIIYLSARIMLVAIFILFAVWGYYIYRFYQEKFKASRENYLQKQEKDVYRPAARKKRRK